MKIIYHNSKIIAFVIIHHIVIASTKYFIAYEVNKIGKVNAF